MNAGMTALQERNKRVAYARELGIEKPHTLKKEALDAAIAEAEALKAKKQSVIDSNPENDGEIHDCPDCGAMMVFQDGAWVCLQPSESDAEESVADALGEREATREAWLMTACEKIAPMLAQAGASNIVRKVTEGKISISVGFPSRTIRKRIGECWAAVASDNGGVNHMFINPTLDGGTLEATIEVLGVIAHELTHADDDCESKHNGHFRKVATAVGLTGKMTATVVGEDLKPLLKDIAEEIGYYPHTKLKLGSGIKKQTTRLIKVHCDDMECPYFDVETGKGYTIRVTQKWIEIGLPTCPC